MADKMKSVEKHLEIVSQTNQKMRDMQTKIEDIEEWRNKEKNVPSSLLVIKSYDINVHTLATIECQDLASRFEENAKKDLRGMMTYMRNPYMTSKGIFSSLRSISKMNTWFLMPSSRNWKTNMKR